MPAIRNATARAFAGALTLTFAVLLAACSGKGTPVVPFPEPSPTAGAASPTATATPVDIRPALAEAHGLLRDGHFEDAATRYEDAARTAVAAEDRAEANLGAAVARFHADDAAGGLQRVEAAAQEAPQGSVVALRAGYLLGLRLNDAGDFDGAANALRPLAEANAAGPLRPYVLAEYGRALSGAGKADAAATWQALIDDPAATSGQRDAAFGALADAARDAGDATAEQGWLIARLGASDTAATRYRLALVSRDVGDAATFTAQLTAIVVNTPGSVYAPRAIDALREAGTPAGAANEGLVWYRQGDYAQAAAVLAAALAPEAGEIDPATRAFATFYLAAAYEDSGQLGEAVATYDRVPEESAASPFAHRARYWAAKVTEELGDAPGAAARYTALVTIDPAGVFSAESAFLAGFLRFEGGDAAAALETWDALPVAPDARTRYWIGRAREAAGDAAGATAAYTALAKAAPLTFFGQEAARRLDGTLLPAVPYRPLDVDLAPDWAAIDAWIVETVPGAPLPSPPSPFVDLLAVGQRDVASQDLLAAADGAGPWEIEALLREAHGFGLADVAALLALDLERAVGREAPVALLRLQYPLDYVPLLDAAAKENGIDPLFLAALVRQESLWNADAGSHAGALGLTQVIPSTGEAIAQGLGYEGFTPNDLFRPAVSLAFGADYIGTQFATFGRADHALAAYNAGPGPLERWIGAAVATGGSAADFVEQVDYPETQHYVEIVLEHYAHYLRAWRE